MFRPVTNSRQVLERFEVTSVYQCRVPRWLRRKVVVTHSKNCSFLSPFPLSLIACNRAGQGSSTGNVLRRHEKVAPRACGIVGIYRHSGNVNAELYEALLMLQHRGQDSAGMVTCDGDKYHEHKGNGLVTEAFSSQALMDKMRGNVGIGHVRYPTAGSSSAQEAQPFFVNSPLGIFLIHNGNLTNTEELRGMLQGSRSFFNRHLRTSSDSEVLLNIFADEIHRAHQRCMSEPFCDPNKKKLDFVFEAGQAMMSLLKGAYSCICLINGVGLVAFRDPHGIRPLVLGKRHTAKGEEWAVASEDCAFGPIGFERVRDVQPGEMLVISPTGQLKSFQCAAGETCPCIFEYIYLSRPDSVLNDISVYLFQLGLGTRLAHRILAEKWEIDCVVPVPDGSRPAAIQISTELGLPYREGLVKNRYVGRTFIMPDQRMRELSVRRKLNAMPAVFTGKRVLLVDDSIVRGTTMRQIVDMVRRAGATKVYLASASPPVRYPNVYGVDMPTRKEFVAADLSVEQIREVLGADGLLYQSVEDLLAVGRSLNPSIHNFEASCFTGDQKGVEKSGRFCGTFKELTHWRFTRLLSGNCKYTTEDINDDYLKALEQSARVQLRAAPRSSPQLAAGAA